MNDNKTRSTGRKESNIYDIICYYDEQARPEHGIQTVNDVICKLATDKRRRQRQHDDKYIKLKLMGCLLINILISAPIYQYGSVYLQQKAWFDEHISLIWPPILYNGIYLIFTPWLFAIPSTYGKPPITKTSLWARLNNKHIVVLFTLVLSLGISISGLLITFSIANFFLMLMFYSVVGGMSSCIIMGKLFLMLTSMLRKDQLHLTNFVYSFGQALTQFLVPFLVNYFYAEHCLNCSMLLLGAILLHIIPIALFIVDDRVPRLKPKTTQRDSALNESRYSDISSISFDIYDIKYSKSKDNLHWKNPGDFKIDGDTKVSNTTTDSPASDSSDDFLQNLDNNRVLREDGVEIMQIIEEEDEKVEIQDVDIMEEVEELYEKINSKYDETQQQKSNKYLQHMRHSGFKKARQIKTMVYKEFLNPMRRSLKLFKFYPSVILKSCEIFSYLLFITLILPNLALIQYRFTNENHLVSLMAFFWIIYTIFILKFHKTLQENQVFWHIAGILCKFFGYLFSNQRFSLNGFIFGLFLISLGHAISFHLQEINIRNEFHPNKWIYVQGPIYSISGFLIIVYSLVFHILYVHLNFINFCNVFVLFNLGCLLFWLLTHYKAVIYIFRRY